MTKKKVTLKYIEQHKSSGLKVGDKVKVVKSGKSYEKGWCNTWADDMDSYVGKICTIDFDDKDMGFRLEDEDGEIVFNFPYFVLEKVKEKKTNNQEKTESSNVLFISDECFEEDYYVESHFKINNQYPAVIRLNGEFFGPFQNKEEVFEWLKFNTDAQDEKNGLFFFTLSNPSRINLSWEFNDVSMEEIFKLKT